MQERKIDPKHANVRTFLRIAGPLILICGVLLTVHGFTGMLGSDDSGGERDRLWRPGGSETFEEKVRESQRRFQEHARDSQRRFEGEREGGLRNFGCIVGGFFLSGLGLMMTAWGFMGAVFRYQAAEIAPVGKDAFNYLAGGTKEGVKTFAGAIGAGFSEGLGGRDPAAAKQARRCQKCGADNDADAKFCDRCGAALAKTACPGCGEVNDSDAKFCDNCGRELRT